MANAPAWGFALDWPTKAVAAVGLTKSGGFPPEPLGDEAWARLRDHASQHRLSGLLVASVARGVLPATDEHRAEMAGLEVELTLNRMWHEGRLVEIVALLADAGVEVRVLKGPALSSLDYPDAQWRPTQDIDLLVRGAEIDRAISALTEVGGTHTDFAVDRFPGFAATVGKGATVLMPGGLEIDLHRLLSWGPLGVRVPPEELWRSGRTFERGGARFETLDVEGTLLHACAHLLLGGWRRALTLRDVAQVLANPALDPERLLVTARHWGAEAVLATGVLLAHRELNLGAETVDERVDDVFGEGAVVTAWARGFAPRLRDRLWLRVQRPDAPIPYVGRLATLVELRTPVERHMLVRATSRTALESYRSVSRAPGWRMNSRLSVLSRPDGRG